ncbi:hypothetical protein BCS58_04265 [Enterovibrio norvegicus]|uniref:hypothetical protein n=1 Tax=Enterovibrio norvegicus TaxID=188144 RepID=UPI00389A155F
MKIKYMYNLKKLFLASLIFIPSLTYAGSQTGKVGYIVVRASDGLVYFTVRGEAAAGQPACATNTYWMIRDENSNSGKQQYSMILSAHASGKVVNVVGMDSCIRWGDGEDVNYIQILGN